VAIRTVSAIRTSSGAVQQFRNGSQQVRNRSVRRCASAHGTPSGNLQQFANQSVGFDCPVGSDFAGGFDHAVGFDDYSEVAYRTSSGDL
jgi:hypothetical protein